MSAYEYCDLKWGSITASGFIAFIIGVATFLFSRHAMGFIVTFGAIVILVLAGILIAEGLFIDSGEISRRLIAGIGVVGVLLERVSLVYPIRIVDTAGILIGVSLVVFGCMMVFAAATVIFDFFVRSIVVFSSFLAILLGIYLILTPESSLMFFSLAIGMFLILFGIVRIVYGTRLRNWQKTCSASYLKKKE